MEIEIMHVTRVSTLVGPHTHFRLLEAFPASIYLFWAFSRVRYSLRGVL